MSKGKNKSFTNKTAVITGAGSGLGRALSLHFARHGWKIAVSDMDLGSAQETLAMLKAEGGSGFANQCDIREENDFSALQKQVVTEFGQLDVLINNAGVSGGGTVEEVPIDNLQWMFDINVLGVVKGYQAFVKMLKQSPRGHVVNIASFAGIANPPSSAAYNMSKAAVVSMSETIRVELSVTNVGVSVVCPAFFKTNLLNSFRSPEDKVKKMADKLMNKSNIQASDVARDIYQATINNKFMVITHKDSRMQYRVKRLFPEFFFKKVKQMAQYLAK